MMRRLLQFAFAFAVLLPAIGQAQEARVTGRVVDAVTQEPVPFASLGLLVEGTGALSNELGYFQLGLENDRPDSLVVASLGFYRRAVFVAPGKAQDLLVKLNHQSITFISCPVVRQKIDWPLFKDGRILGAPNAQYAFFLKNETPQALGVIRSISLYIGERGFPRAPFRLHLYKADETTAAPGTDLLPERRVISSRYDERWCTIDLRDYTLTLPRKGIFIALEFPYGCDHCGADFAVDYIPAGHFIYPSRESDSWSHTPDKGWKVLSLNDNGLRKYRTLIKAEIVSVRKKPLPLLH
jgi:hypothetical protein